MKYCTIKFINSDKSDLVLPQEAILSEHLDSINSPVLFGCRAGICGTCLSNVRPIAEDNTLTGPDCDELEALALYAPGNPNARLVCQLQLVTDITLEKIDCYR